MAVRRSPRNVKKISATSTPKPYENASLSPEHCLSPIPDQHRRKSKSKSLSTSTDSTSGDSDSEISSSGTTTSTPKNYKENILNNLTSFFSKVNNLSESRTFYVSLGAMVISVVVVIAFQYPCDTSINSSTLIEVQRKFPSQSNEIWDAFSSGINEVKIFKKPSVFLLLYDYEASKTIDVFLNAVSRYASGVLNEDYNIEPIILTSNNLNSVKARSDFGYLITKYKPELEEKSVMVVKNLDKIPGQVAQAFHSMCDEYSPLVGKTMYIFTIQVKNLTMEKNDFEVAENILKKSWEDLDDDIFFPLFTRISSMILRIKPEHILELYK